MMMPANFSAVSENEMTYVVGGSIADYLAPAMGATQWSKFHTNMITLIGNKYLNSFIDNTVGAVFSGKYKVGNGFNSLWGDVVSAYDTNGKGAWGVVNAGLQIVGNLAAVYNLGFGTVGNNVGGAYIGKSQAKGNSAENPYYIKTV